MSARQGKRSPKLVRFFMRHVVPIYLDLRKEGDRRQVLFTAFVFSIHDQWLLMTAGHNVVAVQKAREAGYEIAECALRDGLGIGAQHAIPVPYNYDDGVPTMLGIDPSWDYGVLWIEDNTRALLEANGVKALDENSWARELGPVKQYKLLGLPEELTVESANNLNVTMYFLRVLKLDQRPEGFVETNAPMFYGRLPSNPVQSLKGMSGGPIFALTVNEDTGEIRYWLHAMQVSARGDYISGMLMGPLGQFLREVYEGKHDIG